MDKPGVRGTGEKRFLQHPLPVQSARPHADNIVVDVKGVKIDNSLSILNAKPLLPGALGRA